VAAGHSPPFAPPVAVTKLLSSALLAFMAVSSAALFLVALGIWLLTFWWDRRRAVLHRFSCFWASLYTWLIPAWPLTIEGKEHIRPGATYVIVSNHQSLLDILLYFRLFVHFKWVSKVEVFRIPFVGWNMRLNRYIPIRRGDPESAARLYEACGRELARGSSVFLFPEGTRSRDGRLGPFKLGAFRIAQENRVPILPMAIDGTAAALPKHTLNLRGLHPIRIRVLPEIPWERIRDRDPEAVALEVRQRIAEELEGAVA
jgi:1-acyl-sn-glycerol-3-phosphate acyltransferase